MVCFGDLNIFDVRLISQEIPFWLTSSSLNSLNIWTRLATANASCENIASLFWHFSLSRLCRRTFPSISNNKRNDRNQRGERKFENEFDVIQCHFETRKSHNVSFFNLNSSLIVRNHVLFINCKLSRSLFKSAAASPIVYSKLKIVDKTIPHFRFSMSLS